MLKKYIQMIIDNGKPEDMEKLSDMLEEVIYYLKETNRAKYDKYKTKLMGMAYDYRFTEEFAKDIVDKMTKGEIWDMNTVKAVMKNYNVNEDYCEFYIVLNSLANDYGDIISTEDVETYIKMAKAFIDDPDAKEHKVWIYFTKIPK